MLRQFYLGLDFIYSLGSLVFQLHGLFEVVDGHLCLACGDCHKLGQDQPAVELVLVHSVLQEALVLLQVNSLCFLALHEISFFLPSLDEVVLGICGALLSYAIVLKCQV